jgi:hypothetical protein
MKKNIFKISAVLLLAVIIMTGCTFAGDSSPLTQGTPGFLMGVWHGLVAPLSLVIRFFLNIKMYQVPNSGFTYDLGFLIGIVGAIPIGWLAALISIGFYFFS